MKANELRIGNYIEVLLLDDELGDLVNEGDNIEECNYHHIKDICTKNKDWEYNPIPLTEEWLIKFGFDKNEWNHKFGGNTMYWDKADCILHIGDKRDTNYSFMAECNYVHQFQNLYFALTNEELTIK